jgi:ferrous iron transport protein A
MKVLDLTEMQAGESGLITEIRGGHGLERKIQSMGIRPGKKIVKVSSHFWRGPQTIEIDNLHIAIGFGIAQRIFVRVGK